MLGAAERVGFFQKSKSIQTVIISLLIGAWLTLGLIVCWTQTCFWWVCLINCSSLATMRSKASSSSEMRMRQVLSTLSISRRRAMNSLLKSNCPIKFSNFYYSLPFPPEDYPYQSFSSGNNLHSQYMQFILVFADSSGRPRISSLIRRPTPNTDERSSGYLLVSTDSGHEQRRSCSSTSSSLVRSRLANASICASLRESQFSLIKREDGRIYLGTIWCQCSWSSIWMSALLILKMSSFCSSLLMTASRLRSRFSKTQQNVCWSLTISLMVAIALILLLFMSEMFLFLRIYSQVVYLCSFLTTTCSRLQLFSARKNAQALVFAIFSKTRYFYIILLQTHPPISNHQHPYTQTNTNSYEQSIESSSNQIPGPILTKSQVLFQSNSKSLFGAAIELGQPQPHPNTNAALIKYLPTGICFMRYAANILQLLQTLQIIKGNSSIMNDFQFIKELGSGSFGRVIQVRPHSNQNQVYAMKQIKMNQLNAREKDNALNEVRLLASIDSPNIISYKRAFFQEFGSTLCILMEFADGGDLAGLIKKKREKLQKFSENFIWQVAYDILKGLKILHDNHIIHRDIKPANIFFVAGTAKIGDLNVSKVLEGKYASTQTGTPYYTSPQIWNNFKYDGRVDVWSLGCLLYELATLKPPFLAKDLPGLSRKVTLGYYQPIHVGTYSKKLIDLIKKCLIVKMNQRPTAKELLRMDVFEEMQGCDQGQIELLDTIRCPKVLKQLQLPESKSLKKIVTIKCIEKEPEQAKEYPRSLKKIASCKLINHMNSPPLPVKVFKEDKQNEKLIDNLKNPMQSPQGYVKLPRINSQKNILY